MAKKDNTELLESIRDDFKAADDAETEQREQMLDNMLFESGEQWEESARVEREHDNRPSLVINKVAGMVKQLVGNMRQTRSGIKVRPVDSQSDPAVAEVFNGIIRNIENNSDAENAYDGSGEDALRAGLGYFRVLTDYTDDTVFEQDILIEPVENPFTVYRDPYSKKIDGSDSQFYFVTEMMSSDDFKEAYPNAGPASIEGDYDESWITEEEIRVAEYWWVKEEEHTLALLTDGRTVSSAEVDIKSIPAEYISKTRKATTQVVKWCKTNGYEILEDPQEWAGKYIPIIPVVGEVIWIEGRRYYRSAFQHAKDAQRLYNWSRSLAAETLAMAPRQPFITTPEAIEGYESMWELANKKPLPYLLYAEGKEPPTRNAPAFPDNSAMMESAASSDDIKSTTGIYDASLGARGNETSGRAIVARQQQGDTSTFVFQDNRAKAAKFLGRILVDLIPKIYDTERVVRLLNEDGSEGWATINSHDPATGQMYNDITVGKYDVVVDTGPNYKTQRLESADAMIEFIRSFPQAAPVIGPRLAKNLDWPDNDNIAQELKAVAGGPQADPAMQQAQQQQMQMQQQAQSLDLQAKQVKVQSEMQAGQQKLEAGQLAMMQSQQKFQQDMQTSQQDQAQAIQDLKKGQVEIEGKMLDNLQKKKDLTNPTE